MDALKAIPRLRSYLATGVSSRDAKERIKTQIAQREAALIATVNDAVFAVSGSPYRRLLEHAGFDAASFARLIAQSGIERGLTTLYEAGVFVQQAEFKREGVITRGALSFDVRPSDFDHPLARGLYTATTSGSRAKARTLGIDAARLAHEADYVSLHLDAFNARDRPLALWRGVPPVTSGLGNVLRHAKAGNRTVRWFAQNRLPWSLEAWRHRIPTVALLAASWTTTMPIPRPHYVHQENPWPIVDWLASQTAKGQPAYLDTNPSSAVRLCQAAENSSIDISGTLFRVGGEPLTVGKLAVIHRTGCQAFSHYAMAETGMVGTCCPMPTACDDVHLLLDKFAAIQRSVSLPAVGRPTNVDSIVLTTIARNTSKLMLNVETDDYATWADATCGCVFSKLGLHQVLRDIRSTEKLTSEGMNYLGSDLLVLIDETLPTRFGGASTDYQFVETERDGIPIVCLHVSPTLGPLDSEAIRATVYRALGQLPGGDFNKGFWEDAGTLEIRRELPYSTSSAKILPLHTQKSTDRS